MAAFKDSSGRDWVVEIDVNQVKRLRSELGLDLLEVLGGENQVFQRLADDPVLLVDCLWVICREQAEDRSLTDVQFGKSLVGDSIEFATRALMGAITDFFPQGRRDAMKAVAAKVWETQDLSQARALEMVKDPRVNEAIQRMLSKAQLKFASDLDNLGKDLPEGKPSPPKPPASHPKPKTGMKR